MRYTVRRGVRFSKPKRALAYWRVMIFVDHPELEAAALSSDTTKE